MGYGVHMSSGNKVEVKTSVPTPVLKITATAYSKMWIMAKENLNSSGSLNEMSAIGITHPNDPFLLSDFWIPKQKNTGTTTEMDPEDLIALQKEISDRGLPARIANVWFHTHCEMGVFWSGQDLQTISNFKADAIQWSIVVNAKNEILIQANVWSPFPMVWGNCSYRVVPDLDSVREWFTAGKEKISNSEPIVRVPTTSTVGSLYGNNFRGSTGGGGTRDPLYVGVTKEEVACAIGFALPGGIIVPFDDKGSDTKDGELDVTGLPESVSRPLMVVAMTNKLDQADLELIASTIKESLKKVGTTDVKPVVVEDDKTSLTTLAVN